MRAGKPFTREAGRNKRPERGHPSSANPHAVIRPGTPLTNEARARNQKANKYERIYRVIARVPRGRVATYGQIAMLAGLPGHARMVGYALHANPTHKRLPWHRVLGASGRVSLPRERGGALQEALLHREGIPFVEGGRIDLARFGWRPRKASF